MGSVYDIIVCPYCGGDADYHLNTVSCDESKSCPKCGWYVENGRELTKGKTTK